MSIASEIQRIQGAKADIKTAIENKGVVVDSSKTIDEYAELIDTITTEGKTGYARFYRASTGRGTYETYLTDYDENFFTADGNTITTKYDGYILTALRLTTTGTSATAHYCNLLKNNSQLIRATATAKNQYNYSSVASGNTFKANQYTDNNSYPVTCECILILIKS